MRQKGPESSLLFNLNLNYVMRIFFERCTQDIIKFRNFDFRISDAARRKRRPRDYQGNTENTETDYTATTLRCFFTFQMTFKKL